MMVQKSGRNLLLFLFSYVLGMYAVSGDTLQAFLSSFECFPHGYKDGCNEDFIDKYPQYSRSYENFSEARTRWYLFTPKNKENPELLHKCGGQTPPVTNFNPKCKVLLVFPGFVSGVCHMAIYRQLISQRMKCGCYNYIHIEWTWGNSIDLVGATKNMKIVSSQTCILIRNLKAKHNLTSEHFTCMGHSLGAHGCGFIGKCENISEIHGIDPAGAVYWEKMPLSERLDPGDAPCVQVTHCSYGQCILNYFGVNFTCGTKDFFFNDGKHQYSCYKEMFISFLTGDILIALGSLLVPAACHHLQCLDYYKNSMCSPDCKWVGVACKNEDDFKSGNCNDCGENGENCDITGIDSCQCKTGNGESYYLKTASFCPYCDNTGIKNADQLQCKPNSGVM